MQLKSEASQNQLNEIANLPKFGGKSSSEIRVAEISDERKVEGANALMTDGDHYKEEDEDASRNLIKDQEAV